MESRAVRLAAFAVIAGLLLVLAPPVSAEDTVLITVGWTGPYGHVGDQTTATVTVTSLNHQTPATTLHVTYDPSVLSVVSYDALNCGPSVSGAFDCHVPEVQSSFAYNFVFSVLQTTPTMVTGTDSGASGSGTFNAPPPGFGPSVLPVVTGDAVVGGALTTTTGTWFPDYPYTYSYHWERCPPSGRDFGCQTLDGGSSYSVTSADAGCTLIAIVTATAATASGSAASNPTAVVQPDRTCVPTPAPPPPTTTTTATAPSTPPYQFVDHLPEITVGGNSSVPLLACTDGSQTCLSDAPIVAITAGSLPPGMKNNGTVLYGTPYEAGTYTFTLQATYPALNYTPIEKQFTLLVDPTRKLSTGDAPPNVVLPSTSRTPGVIDSAVTQRTIKTTICVGNWTKKIQPPVTYTSALKLKQMKQYGDTGEPIAFEEDHFIPLELGGAPRNPKNLWPEPHSQSRHSDPLERALKRKVCAGRLTLAAARLQIVTFKRKHG